MERNNTEQSQDLILPTIETELVSRLLKKPSLTRTTADIDALYEQLRKVKFFEKYINDNEYDVVKECCKWLQLETFKASEKVFEIGSYGEKFYVILEGKVGVNIKLTKQDMELKTVKELRSGESFGEIALIYKRPRLATIQCIDNCLFGVLTQKNYQNTLQTKELNKMLKEMSIFYNMALFTSWTQNKLRDLYLNSMWLNYKKGDCVYDIGDPADSMFVIQEGEFIVYAKSNFEKLVGEEKQDDFTQFKRKIKSKDSCKIQQYLKVRILCQGEYFGEGEIINQQTRQYKLICNSFEGKVLMIKKAHFLNHVMQDEISKQYIMTRLLEKSSQIEERIQNMKNSLKEYKHYLYQDRGLAEQQILQKSKTQNSIRFDTLDSTNQIINKLISAKQINNISTDKTSTGFRGASNSPLKAQRTLPAISSLTNIDLNEPPSPTKSQTSFQKQNTQVFADQSGGSPTSLYKQKLRFSESQQLQKQNSTSPQRNTDTISTTNRNYEMFVIDSPVRIQLSPSKNSNKSMKQLNLLNIYSPDNGSGVTYPSVKGVSSLAHITEESQNFKVVTQSPTKPKSLIIKNDDLSPTSPHTQKISDQINFNAASIPQATALNQVLTSRTNTSIAQHLETTMRRTQPDSSTSITLNFQKAQNENNKRGSGKVEDETTSLQNKPSDDQTRTSQQFEGRRSNELHIKQYPLQNTQLKNMQKDQDNLSQPRRISTTSSHKKLQNNNQFDHDLQALNAFSSPEKTKLKLQLKSNLASVESTPHEKSPLKLSFMRQHKLTAQSTPANLIKPSQTCLSFSQINDAVTNQNLLQFKQPSSQFSRKSLGVQFNMRQSASNLPIGETGGINLFQVLNQEDQNLLQRQILQKRNHQQDLINLKNYQKTYMRQWRQRSQTRNGGHEKNSKLYFSLNHQNQNGSCDQSKVDETMTQQLPQVQNFSPDKLGDQTRFGIGAGGGQHDSTIKSMKNIHSLVENINSNLNANEDFSPYLKKKIKSLVKSKKSTDSALITGSVDNRFTTQQSNYPVIVKPLLSDNNKDSGFERKPEIVQQYTPQLSMLSFSKDKRISTQSIDNSVAKQQKPSLVKSQMQLEVLKDEQDPIKNGDVVARRNEQKQNNKVHFSLGSQSHSQNHIQTRKSSLEFINTKSHQIFQMQAPPSISNQSFTQSKVLQGIPINKKKIFQNLICKTQVQKYFQNQINMFNKATLLQTHQAVNFQTHGNDDTETVHTLNVSQPKLLDDKKRKTVYSSVDQQTKKLVIIPDSDTVANRQQPNKGFIFQYEQNSPKKSTQATDRNQNSGIHHQFPSFSTSYTVNSGPQKFQESFLLANSMKISQSPPSPKIIKIQSQPTTLQNII